MFSRANRIGLLTGFVLAAASAAARGDGGTLRLLRTIGPYQVAVFTAPAVPVVGPVDVSVLVQDAATGRLIVGVPIVVEASHPDKPSRGVRVSATEEAATNKLFRAAVLDLPIPGGWQVRVTVDDATVEFPLEISRAPLARPFAAWIAWPALAVLLFVCHQVLAARRSRRSTHVAP
jgi:hypothetical protein